MITNFKTYVVHYELLKNRRQNMESALKEKNITFEFIDTFNRENLPKEETIKFINLENHYIANFLSHLEIYKLLVESNDDICLVLEDDSIPQKQFFNKVNKYLMNLPETFDLFYISPGKGNFHIPLRQRRPFKRVYKKENIETSWGGHGASRYADAYFISKKCASILYDDFLINPKKIETTIDWWKNQMIEKFKLNVYWAEPPIIKTNIYETSF